MLWRVAQPKLAIGFEDLVGRQPTALVCSVGKTTSAMKSCKDRNPSDGTPSAKQTRTVPTVKMDPGPRESPWGPVGTYVRNVQSWNDSVSPL